MALESDNEKQERFPYPETLAWILQYSAGVTKRWTIRGQKINFRAASCTGALYHIEIYVITARLPGLQAGIYHYDPDNNQLQKLREGDFRQEIIEASGRNFDVEDAPVILAYSSVFWRNAYKYGARAYRHAFWDSGVIISHSLAIAKKFELNASVVAGFADDRVSKLLGINNEEEIPLALLPLGYSVYTGLKEAPPLKSQIFATMDSPQKRKWEFISEIHQNSSLKTPSAVENWRFGSFSAQIPEPNGTTFQLKPQSTRKMVTDNLEAVIKRRGSTRSFSPEYIDFQRFSNLMKMGTSPLPADFYREFGDRYTEPYLIINAVEDIPVGSYRFYPESNQLEMLRSGYFRKEAKRLGLGQDLAHDAAAIVFFLADLETIAAAFGNRGYRVAQLEGSIFGGKMYLAAYAQGFGATGLTFFDDEVTSFFGQEDKIVTFMICLGHKSK